MGKGGKGGNAMKWNGVEWEIEGGGTECNIQDPEGDMDIFRYI